MEPQPLKKSEIAVTIIGLMLGVLMAALDNTVVGTAMPKLIRDLGGLDLYSWPFTIYFLTSTLAIPVFGRLADQLGRRTVFLAGLVEFILASMLCGMSGDMVSFIVFRGLQGLGGGILISNAFALAGEISRPERRGAYMGMIGSMFGVAGLLGPSVGGFLADGPGWRWAFTINVPLGIAALGVLIFGLRHLKERRQPVRFDVLGLLLFVAAVVPLLLGLSWGGRDYAWTDPVILGLGAAAVVFLALFLWRERAHSEDALLPPWLFGRQFNLAAVGVFLSNAMFFGAILFLPLWMQEVLKVSASTSGLALTPLLFSYTVASVVGGQMLGKATNLRWIALGATAVALAGAVMLTMVNPSQGLLPLDIAMVLIGLGLGATTPVFSIAAQTSVEPRYIGLATATNNFFRNLGGAVGSALLGSVFLGRLHDGLAAIDWGQTPEALKTTLTKAQVLMSPEALKAIGDQVPAQYQTAFGQLMSQIDGKLAAAVLAVFVVMVVIGLISLPFVAAFKRGKAVAAQQTSH